MTGTVKHTTGGTTNVETRFHGDFHGTPGEYTVVTSLADARNFIARLFTVNPSDGEWDVADSIAAFDVFTCILTRHHANTDSEPRESTRAVNAVNILDVNGDTGHIMFNGKPVESAEDVKVNTR